MFRIAVEGSTTQPVTAADLPESINFAAGRPDVNTILGSVRLFRENGIPIGGAVGMSRTLCVIAVPSHLELKDFLLWISPFADHTIQHIRIVRDPMKGVGRYMVLMRFATQDAADAFYRGFNGKPFSSFNAETCHVVYVAHVVLGSTDSGSAEPTTSSFLASDPLCALTDATSSGSSAAPPAVVELPSCPVCLERLDSEASGLLTTICSHSMHTACVLPTDGRQPAEHGGCPVCRYCERPPDEAAGVGTGPPPEAAKCEVCSTTEHLWMCLVCGHVGCEC
jgi:BRCA1-associated protein